MQIPIYHIDTFSNKIFSGNPAAVITLEQWLPEPQLQNIASENHLPATTFLKHENRGYAIRWFTPDDELPLCGHGSLAAGYILFHYLEPNAHTAKFHTHTGQTLKITRSEDWITLNFPVKAFTPCDIPDLLKQAIKPLPQAIYTHYDERCLILLENEDDVRNLQPDLQILRQINYRGFVFTAPGNQSDFVSRTFYPHKTIPEDPVTGTSHCMLIPYWAQKLGKTTLEAYQVSPRGGHLKCQLQGDNVLISGQAALYMQGTITL